MLILGQMVLFLTMMALMWRRRHRKATDASFRWHRFSLAEVFVMATGLAVFMGLSGADRNQRRAELQHRKQLEKTALSILGPDGRLSFDSTGSMSIAICDRTFDDMRLVELAELIRDDANPKEVCAVQFATSAATAATPAQWPGITDKSVEILLQWQGIEMLSIDGTGISAEGRIRLLSLGELKEWSRKALGRKQ